MKLLRSWKNKKENEKGFTLVELIVVLVILAILAAILVPALLGWIDKAREKQYVLDARSVYMAAQSKASEKYAAKKSSSGICAFTTSEGNEILQIADVADRVSNVTDIAIEWMGKTGHNAYTIKKMQIPIDDVVCVLDDGTWTVNTKKLDYFDDSTLDTVNVIGAGDSAGSTGE